MVHIVFLSCCNDCEDEKNRMERIYYSASLIVTSSGSSKAEAHLTISDKIRSDPKTD